MSEKAETIGVLIQANPSCSLMRPHHSDEIGLSHPVVQNRAKADS
jgi:hypothetical protein